jgi:diguanylate cyclase (GGDEF)-like protein/PAS domain S-box-containing protein
MRDQFRTKTHLIAELTAARQRLAELARAEVEQQRLLTIEQQQRALLEAMYQASTTLHSTLQYDQVLDHILDQLKLIVPHDAACIMIPTQSDMARIVRWHGYSRFGSSKFVLMLKIAEIPSLQTMNETGRPVAVPDVGAQDAWVAWSGQAWIKSYAGAPLRIRDQIIGFLQVDSATAGFFSQADAEHLEAFASFAVLALKNAWNYGRARREIMQQVKALKTERNFVSTVLDMAGALVVILNAEKRIVRFNQTSQKTSGYLLDEVQGRYLWDLFIVPEEVETVKAICDRLSAGHFPIEYESQWLTKEGECRLIAWSSTVLLDNQGSVEYIIKTGHDITERKQVEEALRTGGERYALAVQAANEGLWDWNLKTNEIYFSPHWKTILGYEEQDIQPSVDEWFGRVHPEDLARLKMDIATHLEGATTGLKSEYRMLHGNGDYRWVLTQGLAVRDAGGRAYRLTGSQTDITRRKMTENELRHASLHDALTGLPNRVQFMQHLERAIGQVKENTNYVFAVLFLDLDRLKLINDNLGHLIGDQLLITVARRLKNCLRPGDTVARLGGDEFTILLENIQDAADATRVAERLHNELALPIHLEGHKLLTSASIGIALSTSGYDRPEDILRDADTTMYWAKARGRACHELFDPGLDAHPLERRELETELRQAVEQQEFQLYYQPIVSLATGQMSAVEALLRWQHPQRGLIEPDKFISLAEETGLIIPMGEWVLRSACAQIKAWHAAGHSFLRLAVNVSIRQLQPAGGQQDLPGLVTTILSETGLAAQALELEITESMPLINNDFNRVTLNELKMLGLQVALDDYSLESSLNVLKQFPFNTLKIDRSLIKEIAHNPEDAAIIQAIISLAHELRLRVIAEGVETEEQLVWLRDQQCDEFQGYLFSPPVPAPAITQLLQARQHLEAEALAKSG